MRPRRVVRFPYVPTFGPASVSLAEVIVTEAWAVLPSMAVAVTVAVKRPGS